MAGRVGRAIAVNHFDCESDVNEKKINSIIRSKNIMEKMMVFSPVVTVQWRALDLVVRWPDRRWSLTFTSCLACGPWWMASRRSCNEFFSVVNVSMIRSRRFEMLFFSSRWAFWSFSILRNYWVNSKFNLYYRFRIDLLLCDALTESRLSSTNLLLKSLQFTFGHLVQFKQIACLSGCRRCHIFSHIYISQATAVRPPPDPPIPHSSDYTTDLWS